METERKEQEERLHAMQAVSFVRLHFNFEPAWLTGI
jgi:hypothetical protein